jgi:hypothetical protein
MEQLGKLNTRRTLIAITLLVAVAVGIYELRYFDFPKSHEITPFAKEARIAIPVKGIKFSDTPVEISPKVDLTVTTLKPLIEVHFKVEQMQYGTILEDVFYSVEITFKVDGQYAILTLVNNNRWWGNGDIESYLTLPFPVTGAPLEIILVAYPALHGPVSETLEVLIYLVETG